MTDRVIETLHAHGYKYNAQAQCWSKGEQMNKQEIDEMMSQLPSQQGWREETTTEKWIGGLAFTLFLIMICFI